MRPVLYSEIAKERCNAKALGAFNSAVKIVKEGRSGGDSLKEVFDYIKLPSETRRQMSIDGFNRAIKAEILKGI